MNERHARGEGKIDYLEGVLIFVDDFEPFLDACMADDFPHIVIGIVQQYVRILVCMLDGVQKVVFYIFIGVAAVDEGDIDRG